MWLVFYEKVMNFVTDWIEFLKFKGLAAKNDTFHTDIQVNGPELGICSAIT